MEVVRMETWFEFGERAPPPDYHTHTGRKDLLSHALKLRITAKYATTNRCKTISAT